jgi:Trypsin-like peptidase domain
VVSGAAATVVDRGYFAGGGSATGSLGVTLLPAALGASAQWRLLGEDDGAWRASGASLGGLAAGVYLVESKDVAGYATPRPRSVTVGEGEAKSATVTYFLADAPVGAQPATVGFDAVSADGNESAARFVGQLRSDAGAGTGFVVRPRVVCTAAHVVFDDGTLSAATGLQWLFQRERGTYEPVPQIPRGSYILTGFAAQRTADNSPGTSSAAAQNLDVASVWFFEEDAARGGAGGYLASDSLDNEWLLSPRLKTIVGYPLDDTAAANQGRIHATPPMNVAFAHANGRVYLTDDITSRGGNSGGPVMVQYDDGAYFPAAVYLGGTTQTRVRAIDGDVIDIFDSAEESGDTGQNSTNGGVAQLNSSAGAPASGILRVLIEPAAARSVGAGWRIGSGGFLNSGQTRPFLSPGNYTVNFKTVEGFTTPAARAVTVAADATTSITVSYAPAGSAPAPVAAPTYTGLLGGPDGASGLATLSVTKAGRFTLTLRLAGEKLRLTGTLDASGGYTGQIARRGKTAAGVTLSAGSELVPPLAGAITVDGTTFALSGGRPPFTAKNTTPLSGAYTLVLPRDPAFGDPFAAPWGHGYAVANVSRDGKVRGAGKLGDGTGFAASAPLFADATCPLFAQPYAARGLLAGTLTFHDAPAPDAGHLDGTLRWQKPAAARGRYAAGFTGGIAALGSRWTPPARGAAALDLVGWELEIGAGVLAPPLTATAALSAKNFFSVSGANGIKLKLTPASGLLSGSFPGTNRRPVAFKGAVLQRQRISRGAFIQPDRTGPVTLDAP